MWLTKFKTALVLEEIDKLATLLDEMPQFSSLQEMEEAAYLLRQATELLMRNKHETALTLKHLKNTLEFLKTAQSPSNSALNIKL